jgi:hypothetical protein
VVCLATELCMYCSSVVRVLHRNHRHTCLIPAGYLKGVPTYKRYVCLRQVSVNKGFHFHWYKRITHHMKKLWHRHCQGLQHIQHLLCLDPDVLLPKPGENVASCSQYSTDTSYHWHSLLSAGHHVTDRLLKHLLQQIVQFF